MKNKDQHNDEDLDALSPLLMGMDKSNKARVPDGYFEALPSVISEKIAAVRSTTWLPLIPNRKYRLGWITGFASLAVLVVFLFKPSGVQEQRNDSMADVFDYVEQEYLEYFTEDELEDVLVASLSDADNFTEMEGLQSIEEELLNEDIDIESLIDEL